MASPPKLRSIPIEALEGLPEGMESLIQMLNGYLTDAGNAFDALFAAQNAETLETDWTPLPASKYLNGWRPIGSPYGGVYYKRYPDGFVRVIGEIAGGTVPSDVFVLPDGFRPADRMVFAADSNTAHARVDVTADGVVKVLTGNTSDVSLTNIGFQAASKRRS